jgi:hypothetical protein
VKDKATLLELTSTWAINLLEDNPLLSNKLMTNLRLHHLSDVNKCLIETIRFLYLCSKTNQALTPSVLVDNSWHEFILFTRSYKLFCETKLQRFIHHQPSDSPNKQTQQYKHTLDLYNQHFGQPATKYWPNLANNTHTNKETSTCGSCEN